jgi:(p)ppGpp synthase/HD superfamily hydrolase
MSYHCKIRKALKFAAKKHVGQFRKGTDIPYLVHPVEVGLYLQNLGMAHDTIIAGYLHDTIEDTDTTYDELKYNFGEGVADVVLELSERSKKRALVKAQSYSPEAVKVKTADLMCNVTDILDEYNEIGNAVFDKFAHGKKTLDHYRNMAQILHEKAVYLPQIRKELSIILTKLDYMS